MGKHAAWVMPAGRDYRRPTHSTGWIRGRRVLDSIDPYTPYTPGRHAKPFAAHHPARPVTYNAAGTTTPLNPPTHVLDVAA